MRKEYRETEQDVSPRQHAVYSVHPEALCWFSAVWEVVRSKFFRKCKGIIRTGGNAYRSKNPQRNQGVSGIHLLRALNPTIHLLAAGTERRSRALFCIRPVGGYRKCGLDLHSGSSSFRCLRLLDLPRYDGRADPVGLVQVTGSDTPPPCLSVGQSELSGPAACH